MNDSPGSILFAVSLTILVTATACFGLSAIRERNLTERWRAHAVEHGCGGYDRQTGDWTWGAQ